MNRLTALALVAGLSVPFQAQALPLVSIYGGAYNWQNKATGDIASNDQGDVDFSSELGLDKDNSTVLFLGVEHAIPVLPNVRLSHVNLSDSGNGTLNSTVTIDGKSFNATDKVASSYDLDMTDLTLYYRPWETFAQVNVGLTLRRIDADFKVRSKTERAKLSASKTIPMGYAEVSAKLPYGLYAGGEVNAISVSGNKLSDVSAKVGWRSPALVGIEAGYRQMNLTLDDVSDIDSDLKFKGPYVALTLAF